jgi:hypothetical protein
MACVRSTCVPMSTSSLAHRIRSSFIRLGLWASVLTFLFIETDTIPDQWKIGRASVVLLLALLAVGVSIGVFVAVAAIGMVASAFATKQSQGPSGSNGPIGSPRAASRGHTNPGLDAQGTLMEPRVLICRIDSGGRSMPIYFNQHSAPTIRQSVEVREPSRYHPGPPVVHCAPVGIP